MKLTRAFLSLSVLSAAATGAVAQTAAFGDLDTLRGTQSENRPSAPTAATGPAAPVEKGPAALGWKVGDLMVYPSVTGAWIYDDNVFATRANRQGDSIFVLRPEILLRSTGEGHDIQANGFLEGRRYTSFSSEDQVNGGLGLGGTVQINRDTQVQGRVQYLRGHESRGSGESVFASTDRPTGFDQFEGSLALNKRFDRVWTSLGVAGLAINYDDARIGGVLIDQRYRNGVISVANGRVGVVVAPRTSLFAEVAVNRRDFRVNDFTSTGGRVVAGVLLEPGPDARVKGEAYAGYMYQNYEGAGFATVSTWTFGGALGWLVTPNFTITTEGRREAKESALAGGVSLIETQVGARADYQIAPNIVVGAGLTYVVDDFQTVGRSDRYWSPLATARYIVNPNVAFGLDYRRLSYQANDFTANRFDRDVYMVSLNGKF